MFPAPGSNRKYLIPYVCDISRGYAFGDFK